MGGGFWGWEVGSSSRSPGVVGFVLLVSVSRIDDIQ